MEITGSKARSVLLTLAAPPGRDATDFASGRRRPESVATSAIEVSSADSRVKDSKGHLNQPNTLPPASNAGTEASLLTSGGVGWPAVADGVALSGQKSRSSRRREGNGLLHGEGL